jgi:soluble lytic murein transglycosylase-like protein
MSRPLLTILTGALLSGLSCAVTPPTPGTDLAGALPAVSAGPDDASGALAEREASAIERYLLRKRTGLSRKEVASLARTILAESHAYEMDPTIVLAVMHVESRFDTFAVSPVGARGLMQLLPATGEEMALKHGVPWNGTRTLFDPEVNVKLGVAYLRELSDRYGDISTALAAYNWGPGRIDRRLRRGSALPAEYPQLVLHAHAEGRGIDRRS